MINHRIEEWFLEDVSTNDRAVEASRNPLQLKV
jgi:hypothetical protein